MKFPPSRKSFQLIGFFLLFSGTALFAPPPGWWTGEETRIIDENADPSPLSSVNAGQLKHVAQMAKKHLDANLVGGAGSAIDSLVGAFEPQEGVSYTQAELDAIQAAQFSPVNLAQLKAVGKVFLDRLLASGYGMKANLIARGYPPDWPYDYPWDPNTPREANLSPALLGQLKMVFSFDLEAGALMAMDGTLEIEEDTLGTINLQSFGGGNGAPEYEIIEAPQHGTAIPSGTTVRYYPNAHYHGTDSFQYRVTKGENSDEGEVAVTVHPVNDPPLVYAGANQAITLPATAALSASVSDIDTDSQNVTVRWTQISGPGDVTFGDAEALSTTATFSEPGEYELRISGNDGASVRSDSLAVVVHEEESGAFPTVSLQAPADNAGIAWPESVTIMAQAGASGGATVSKVEFYEGSRKIGEDTTAASGDIYEMTWIPPRIGVYGLSARVTDSAGRKNFSSARTVRITIGGWFPGGETGNGPGNGGYSGSGGDGGASAGGSTGPGGDFGGGSGVNGGGGTASGGGDGLGEEKGSENDTDGDGLTDAEELERGTDPLNADPDQDSDGDNVPDLLDAVPLDEAITWERIPPAQYAVVSLAGATGKDAMLAVGNNGSVLAATRNSFGYATKLKVWKNGEWTNLNLNIPIDYKVDVTAEPYQGAPEGPLSPAIDYHVTKTTGTFPISIDHAMITDAGDIFLQGEFHFPDLESAPFEGPHMPFSVKWPGGQGAATSLLLPRSQYSFTAPVFTSFSLYQRPDIRVARSGLMIVQAYTESTESDLDHEHNLQIQTTIPGNQFDYTYEDWWHYDDGEGGQSESGTWYGLLGVSRSGYTLLYASDSKTWFFSGEQAEELAASAISDTPKGDAMIYTSGTTKIRLNGTWTQTKKPLPKHLNQRGEGLGEHLDLWRNGVWRSIDELIRREDDPVQSVKDINDNGIILATLVNSGPCLLIPVELYDENINSQNVAWNGEIINLVQIQSIPTVDISALIKNNGMALIQAHTDQNDVTPQMPKLVARAPNPGASSLTYKWRLEVKYERPNGGTQATDTVRIPINGSYAEVPADGEWRIFEWKAGGSESDWDKEIREHGFFGGDAKLFLWTPGAPEPTKPIYEFRIGGENPVDEKCKTYIDGLSSQSPYATSERKMWYAYAIAKTESKDYNDGVKGQQNTRYNQFWEKSGSGSDRGTFKNGDPLWIRQPGEPGAGGYGLFQVTGSVAGINVNIPREQLWNWQKNVKAALEIIKNKRDEATYAVTDSQGNIIDGKSGAWDWMNDPQNRPGTSFPHGQRPQAKNWNNGVDVPVDIRVVEGVRFEDGTDKIIEDAATIKMYNGASVMYCSWGGTGWAFNNTNPSNFDYVGRVCKEVEP